MALDAGPSGTATHHDVFAKMLMAAGEDNSDSSDCIHTPHTLPSPTIYPFVDENTVAKLELCRERVELHARLKNIYKIVLELVEAHWKISAKVISALPALGKVLNAQMWSIQMGLNMSIQGNAVKCTQWRCVYVSNQKQAVWNYMYVTKYMLFRWLFIQLARLTYILLSRLAFKAKLLYANVNVGEDICPWTQKVNAFVMCGLKWAAQTYGYTVPNCLYKIRNIDMRLCTETHIALLSHLWMYYYWCIEKLLHVCMYNIPLLIQIGSNP